MANSKLPGKICGEDAKVAGLWGCALKRDVCYCVAKQNAGLIYVEGRLKELIKVKGFQVAPAELEEVIRAYDKIQDVGVVGVPHDKYGEIPKALVVPKPGVEINEDELKAFVAERVADFKQLGYVRVVEGIPRNASGKILRKALRDL